MKIKGQIYLPFSRYYSLISSVRIYALLDLVCKDWGLEVEERRISEEELHTAAKNGTLEEVFGSGTAAVISPVGTLKFGEEVYNINNSQIGEISQKLYDTITGIQTGKLEDKYNWIVEV